MSGNGRRNEVSFDGLSSAYRRPLWAVIAINAAMFVAQMSAGLPSGFQALKASALDLLDGNAPCSIPFFVMGMPLAWGTLTDSRAVVHRVSSLRLQLIVT